MSAEWDNFIRRLNPAELERERLGTVPDSERPGSPEHMAMLEFHERNRAVFHLHQRAAWQWLGVRTRRTHIESSLTEHDERRTA